LSDNDVARSVIFVTRAELLDAALEACGGDEYELAKELGLGLDSAARQFARWRRGEGMNFETTIRLLEIADLLKKPNR
jgi:hypothetical protein